MEPEYKLDYSMFKNCQLDNFKNYQLDSVELTDEFKSLCKQRESRSQELSQIDIAIDILYGRYNVIRNVNIGFALMKELYLKHIGLAYGYLGDAVHNGWGTVANPDLALIIYKEGASLHDEYCIGMMYFRHGEVIKAKDMFKSAILSTNHLRACMALAMCYPNKPHKKFKWLMRAANQGFAYAQYLIGMAFENGDGVPIDLQKAKSWYKIASCGMRCKEAAKAVLRTQHL